MFDLHCLHMKDGDCPVRYVSLAEGIKDPILSNVDGDQRWVHGL